MGIVTGIIRKELPMVGRGGRRHPASEGICEKLGNESIANQ
jgi:hypothetical protein